ncbi:glycosyltransferase [Cupriavidus sp. 2KB_3]|uniref:glycosyltransferase n=1 Tax=Cupriavidus sp. 2KB_3 TaxID=3232980 RepID=UPI003F8DF309
MGALNRSTAPLTVSVVSHGQAAVVTPLLLELDALAREFDFELILTENLPDAALPLPHLSNLRMRVLHSPVPQGFGENHNRAFREADCRYFCVLNPDARLDGNPFSTLIDALPEGQGVAGPRVQGADGGVEDSARHVPTLAALAGRYLGRRFEADYDPAVARQSVDWVAGMCMMFDAATFARLGGFDERFHLYCEDVDICLRAHLAGAAVLWVQDARIGHAAQRDSRKRLKYLMWHVGSMLRLISSDAYRRFKRRRVQSS